MSTLSQRATGMIALLFLFLMTIGIGAQVTFEEHIVSTEVNVPISVSTGDLDGDGTLDIVSASISDHKIAWYPNTGNSTFGDQIVIDNELVNAQVARVFDLDSDGDMDIVAASGGGEGLVWYENIDGNATFSNSILISTDISGPRDIDAADLDGDDDLDLISASVVDDKIAWYENVGGDPLFGSQMLVDTTFDGAKSVKGVDIDGDGDQDILAAASSDDNVSWYENLTGEGDFSNEKIISTEVDDVNAIYWADIDGDGDFDVLSASFNDFKVAWYENLDGMGNFGDQNVITTNALGANALSAADIDNDGDFDVVVSSQVDSRIAWYENTDGLGAFGSRQTITSNHSAPTTVHSADLDNDGDVDVVAASHLGSNVFCMRNELVVTDIDQPNAQPHQFVLHSNYPNPFNPATTIRYQLPSAANVSLKIYDSLGRVVKTLVDGYQISGSWARQWDGTDEENNQVGSGIYVSVLQAGSTMNARKMLLLR